MIEIVSAPPFATVQDLGRTGYRDSGVPVSGVADRDSALELNVLLGNDENAAMIEWAVAGGALRFHRDEIVCIGGASASCTLDGQPVSERSPVQVSSGAELRIERILRGRFLLIAVRGGIDVPIVLGSRSTLVSARIGGLDGRRLRSGDRLLIGDMISARVSRIELGARHDDNDGHDVVALIRIRRGPQSHLFNDASWAAFLDTELVVSRASDRAGYRLDGVALTHSGAANLPSEPVCVGAIQVPDGGAPIVIMHDGPTVGGYPKIGVIRTADLSRFAQLAPGDRVRFVVDG
jgi:antagonist of KipI